MARLTLADGSQLAYEQTPGRSPGVVFLGGFRSDMEGSKALFLENLCKTLGLAFVRFDYLGHGQSSGKFEEGTISRWTQDALTILEQCTQGPQIVVGSSMGGWLMLLAALAQPQRIKALVGIASAPDFLEELVWPEFSEEAKQTLEREGAVFGDADDPNDPPYHFTQTLMSDGRKNLLLPQKHWPLTCPVRLLHGMQDTVVPWKYSQKIVERVQSEDVTLMLIKDGDHRLARPQDLEKLRAVILELTEL